jgi:hypothetical protein
MVDKIKPLKIEDSISGTEIDPFPTESNPIDDYLATKGLAGENLDTSLFDLSASKEWQWKDSVQTTPYKLNDILSQISASGRGLIPFSYGGNANTGRYLEFFSNIDTSIAPIYSTVALRVTDVVAGAAANATCTIGFYNGPTLLYTLTFTAQNQRIITGTPSVPVFTLPATGSLSVKVDSGSISKPYLYIVGIAQ